MKKIMLLGVITAVVLMGAAVAVAVPIYGSIGESTEQLGYFTGELTYSDVNNQLTVVLNNEANPLHPEITTSYITQVLFNYVGGMEGAILSSAPNYFVQATGNALKLSPYGSFDFGAVMNNPPTSNGIALGGTGIFVFDVTPVDLVGSEVEAAFIEALNAGVMYEDQVMLVRFQGINSGNGSDKVPGAPDNPVPEPATMLLLGPALAGLALARKKD